MSDSFVFWLENGFLNATWWQIIIYLLVTTHNQHLAVTIFLHRSQAHRALDLHPIVKHYFRFVIWGWTGMVTKAWVALHRKHHAKCETADDPHSPQTRGLWTVLLKGAELYRAEAKNKKTLARYGHGTPDDWIERHVYSRHVWLGVGLLLVTNLLLFGGIGATVWAVQMAWIPVTAAGIINGIGHYWGYRNFDAPDASTNICPLGIFIGGEELHNNHHTFPTSAKLSVLPHEVDIGWFYIRLLEMVGLAKVRHTPPEPRIGKPRESIDSSLLESLIRQRYYVLAFVNGQINQFFKSEVESLRQNKGSKTSTERIRTCLKWLGYPDRLIPDRARQDIKETTLIYPDYSSLLQIKNELTGLWSDTIATQDQPIARLKLLLNGWRRNGAGYQAQVADLILRLK